jgi:hypothetical protein
MYKQLFILLFSLFFSWGVSSQTLDNKTIGQLATRFLSAQDINPNKSIDFSRNEIIPIQAQGETALYLVNYEDGAFVLFSAHQHSIPVLAFSTESNMNMNDLPPALELYLADYANITYGNKDKTPTAEQQQMWDDLFANNLQENKGGTKGVSALLDLRWGQSYPYNALCPEHPSGSNGRCVTGCVATAMGMVMKYWEHPIQGSGQKTYFWGDYYTVHFDSTYYDWQNMGTYASVSNHIPIATLLFHCGVSSNMNYGPSASGTQTEYAANALKMYFDYIPTLEYLNKNDYSVYDWKYMLVEELDKGRPVLYSGYDPNQGGHAFICDGYMDTIYYHFNWGWNGGSNGYFSIINSNPNTISFNQSQGAIFGVMPPTTPFCSGMEYTQDEWTFDDGSYYSYYQNNMSCEWLIEPVNGGPIALNFTSFETEQGKDVLYIYDGTDANAPLIGTYSGAQIPQQIISSGNALFLRFETDGTGQMEGWKLSYSNKAVGIAEKDYAPININVYPQPADESFQVEFHNSKADNMILQLYDINGRLIKSINYSSQAGKNNIQIDVSDLMSGLYILKIKGSHFNETKKISVL